jgi:hypothetical protein
MKPKWWGAAVQCQTCDIPANINGLNFSADGELAITARCPKCQRDFFWKVFASALAHRALLNDMTAHKVEKLVRNSPLRPPLELPAPPPHLSNEDAAWFLELHIDPESGSLQ